MKTTRLTVVLGGGALLWPLWLLSAGCDEGSFVVSDTSAGGTAGSGGDSSSGTGGAAAVLTAADDSYTVTANGYLVEGAPGVLANDLTPISSVTVTLLSGASDGSLELAGDGSFTYAPRPFFVGTDSFEYTVDDGTAQSSATATITVLPDVGDGSDGDLVVSASQVENVNKCFVIESTTGASVTLSSPTLAVGDRLLLLQVQDGSATLGDQTPFGPDNVFSNAGVSQIVTVTSVGIDDSIGVAPPPVYGFNTAAGSTAAQACRVPQFGNVTVAQGGTIHAERWDGSVSGVVAFFVAGTATIDGLVSAASAGFRGGQLREHVYAVGVVDLEPADPNHAGGKGDGPDASSYGRSGRGNLFSAAGGGNGLNAGGGGGGHYGAGGFGGKQWVTAGDEPNTRGMGGAAFIFPVDERLMLGGGGGAGHHDVPGFNGGAGGRGGGIIFIWGNAINGSGNLIAVGGLGGESSNDGAGGGGAGGTIFVRAQTSSFAGAVIANGGNGGDITGLGAVGPGGGGGGGRLLLVGIQPNTMSVAGGTAGHFDNDPWGATDGGNGNTTLIP